MATVRYLIPVVALGVADLAHGQASPYSLGVSQEISYQANVFQVASGEPRTNDFVASTGLQLEISQVVDIYRFLLSASAQSNTYQDTKVLNSPSYSLRLGAASNAERLSTNLEFLATQSLGDYATPNVAQTTEKNIQNTEQIGVGVRYASTPRVNVGGGLAYQWNSFSAAAFQSQESSQGAAVIDVSYQVTPVLQIGAGPRYTRGITPKYGPGTIPGSFVADDFDGKYIDLLAAWGLSADSSVSAGLSLSRVTHTVATQLNYSGLTGFANWSYRVGGKLGLSASLAQTTGLGGLSGMPTSPFLLGATAASSAGGGAAGTASAAGAAGAVTPAGSVPAGGAPGVGVSAGPTSGPGASDAGSPSVTNNNRLNRTVSFGASYSLGSKTDLRAGLSLNNGFFANTSGTPGSARTTSLDLGVTYVPVQALSLACNLNLSRQDANQAAVSSGQAHSYDAWTAGCTVQYTLR